MRLFLVKPDLIHFNQYADMMREWRESDMLISPWFLGAQCDTLDEFAAHIRMLDGCAHGIVDARFATTSSYFAMDERGRLVGAASLRHYLTVEGLNTWGHIGYGVRPSARGMGCATEILRLALDEARCRKIYRVLLGAHTSNAASCRVIEKCGGALENTVPDPTEQGKFINRYWIDNFPNQ